MAKSGPVIIIEDDSDDKYILEQILRELNMDNALVWFTKCDEALQYLKATDEQPFIIFSDINLPGQSGIEFKRNIDKDKELRKKSIPFVFYSTTASQQDINEAYTQMTVQGFFIKADSYAEARSDIKLIIEYWLACRHPNTR